MSNHDQIAALTEAFHQLGADDPDSWAHSQVDEGIPQLAMYVFLKRAAEVFGTDGLKHWLISLAHENTRERSSAKQALSRIADKGVSHNDIRQILLIFYRELLMEFSCLLDNNSSAHFDDEELNRVIRDVNWRLFSVDDKGSRVAPMDALHEIVNDCTTLPDT